jgi:hypothetical protein
MAGVGRLAKAPMFRKRCGGRRPCSRKLKLKQRLAGSETVMDHAAALDSADRDEGHAVKTAWPLLFTGYFHLPEHSLRARLLREPRRALSSPLKESNSACETHGHDRLA